MTRTLFLLAKPNQTGLTKIQQRFFFFFSLIYHLKKSLKVKNVAKTVYFYCLGAIKPKKSVVMFPLKRSSNIKWVILPVSSITFFFFVRWVSKNGKKRHFWRFSFHIESRASLSWLQCPISAALIPNNGTRHPNGPLVERQSRVRLH